MLSHFSKIPASFACVIRVLSLRLYAEMLALNLSSAGQSDFNSIKFLQACSLLLKLFKSGTVDALSNIAID